MLKDHQGLKLIKTNANGYFYNKEGFSLFKEENVDLKDVMNVKLMVDFMVSNYPELCNEMVETAVGLTNACPTVDVNEVFEDTIRMTPHPIKGGKHFGIANRLLKCSHKHMSLKAVVFLPSGMTVKLEISPLGLVTKSGEFWLACLVHNDNGGHQFRVIPVRSFEDTFHTDVRYRSFVDYRRLLDQDFESHIHTHVRSRDDGRGTIH